MTPESRASTPCARRAQARAHRRLRRLPHRGHRNVPGLHAAPRASNRRRTLRVGDDVLEAKRFVIATGSSVAPRGVPGACRSGFHRQRRRARPRGAAEVAHRARRRIRRQRARPILLARRRAETTILIRAKHLLSGEDHDVGDGADRVLPRRRHRASRRGAQVQRVERARRRHEGRALPAGRRRARASPRTRSSTRSAACRTSRARSRAAPASSTTRSPGSRSTTRCAPQPRHLRGRRRHRAATRSCTSRSSRARSPARNAAHGAHERADYRLTQTHTIFTDPQVAVVGETENDLEARRHAVPAARRIRSTNTARRSRSARPKAS